MYIVVVYIDIYVVVAGDIASDVLSEHVELTLT